ncbi:MAG: hypothetical protein MJY84_01985 [Bacteroidales bacterium]|nr:hypothetical protein [Bacteroidales bacterium]
MNNNDNTTDRMLRYRSPRINLIEINVQNVLCLSPGNESMREYDYGDGGFVEE